MRYVFGCAVLCLGLSAADSLSALPVSTPSTSKSAMAELPIPPVEEGQASPIEQELSAAEEKRTASREQICESVASAAQANDLPIAFLASLVWQESRFNPKAVSPVGAQGIAQFMPRIAAAFGLADPFDPLQALPASARFLRELYQQFGNLGLAAAAYNAGPKRVLDWMANRGRLPSETRTYVLNITGRPAEQWVSKIDNAAFKIPARTPCQSLLASLPEWSSAGSGQLTPDLPDVAPATAKPMIVITKNKVIVTGPQPKTLALKQPKTKVAVAEPKAKLAATQSKIVISAQSKTSGSTRQSKAIVIAAQSNSKATVSQSKGLIRIGQPKPIMAAEPKAKTRMADKKDPPKSSKSKPAGAAAKLAANSAGKNAVRPAAAQRIRTAAARG
jgi:hypothetical protein